MEEGLGGLGSQGLGVVTGFEVQEFKGFGASGIRQAVLVCFEGLLLLLGVVAPKP